jgi:uncharacterized membrane protein
MDSGAHSELTSIWFDSDPDAREAFDRGHTAWLHAYAGLEGIAFVKVDKNGDSKIETPSSRDLSVQISVGSAVLGGFVGLIFLAPVWGAAIGGGAAAAISAGSDLTGLSEQLRDRVRAALPPGRPGIVMFSTAHAADGLAGDLAGQTGHIERVPLTADEETTLRDLIKIPGT